MNIGIVTTWFPRGASYVTKQYEATLSEAHNVYIYARGGEMFGSGPEWEKHNVHFGSLKWGKKIDTLFLDDFTKWIKEKNIELVIFNEEHWWKPVLLCNALGVLTAAYVDYYTKETVPFFTAYDILFCHTRRHYQVFKDHPQAYYIPWGTDTDLFTPTKKNELVFFHSAGMSPYRKGTDILIQAFTYIVEDCRVIIHSQKPIEVHDPRITVVQKTVEPPGLYHMGSVYVYPTRLEGIGLSLPEALSCGLPAIVPDEGPMNEFVQSSFGILVPVEKHHIRHDGYYWPECEVSPQALAVAMQTYIAHPELVFEQSAKARAFSTEDLSWKKNSQKLLSAISQSKKIAIVTRTDIAAFESYKYSYITRVLHKIKLLGFGFFPYTYRYVIKNYILKK